MRRLIALLAATAAILFFTPVGVQATTTGDEHEGSFYNEGYNGGEHFVFAGWSDRTVLRPPDNEVNLRVETGAVAQGTCIQIAFDWLNESPGHYDPRIVRNCDPNSTRRTPLDYLETRCGIVACALHAHSVQIAIYHQDDGSLTNKQCWLNGADRTCAGWNPADGPTCARIWGRHRTGDDWYQSGGTPTSCTA